MQKVLLAIRDIFKFHKLKIVSIFLFTLLFALLIFPFSDLADLVTMKVADLTQNQVYLQMDGLGLSILPGPGLSMENVLIEAPSLPTLSASRLAIAPSILGLLSFSPGFSARAEGLFRGLVNLGYRQGSKTKSGQIKRDIDIDANGIAMAALSQFLRDMDLGDMKLQGSMNLKSNFSIDPAYEEQPKGNLDLGIKNFVMPSRVVNISLGPLQIPEIKLQNVTAKGALADGRLSLDNVTLGGDHDEMRGKISGDINMRVLATGGPAPVPNVSGFDLKVDLTMTGEFQKRAALFLMILDPYKTQSSNGVRYAFRVKSSNIAMPPQFLPYQ